MASLEAAIQFLDEKKYEQALACLASIIVPSLDFRTANKISKLLKRIPEDQKSTWTHRTVKLAILAGSTMAQLVPLIEAFFLLRRIKVEIRLSDFNFEAAILSRDSAIESFQPDLCLLATGTHNIGTWPKLPSSRSEYDEVLQAETSRWLGLHEKVKGWLKCTIIQDGFCLPTDRPLGHFENHTLGGKGRFVRDLNQALLNRLDLTVRFNDLDFQASKLGRNLWLDRRFWLHGKLAIAPDASAAYCLGLSSLVGAVYGLTKKCLVVDLDNTLWGGVIGDDGLQGIVFGEGSGDGEAFKAFQLYLQNLKSQGVLLAVVSKNEELIAKEPFEKLADKVLSLADFDVFLANWKPKSENLLEVAKLLNIGMDSLVFFDDNPAEREEVVLNCPDVFVVNTPNDPTDYISSLDCLNLFEPSVLTKEDTVRSVLYAQQKERTKLAQAPGDYASYLRALEMKALIRPFVRDDIPRISQLINKTNQFNLTTRRYSEVECTKILSDPQMLTRTVRLWDKFGDNGLISVLIGKYKDDAFEIDTWLMSCRVLKRSVEELLLSNVLKELGTKKVKKITGRYLPSPKNKMVEELYQQFGFTRVKQDSTGSVWELNLPAAPPVYFIKEVDESHGD